MSSILDEVPLEAGKWIKYVICALYPRAVEPRQTLFTIYQAIHQEGSFKPIVLFFHILRELDKEGIAERLAVSVDCENVEAGALFSCTVNERSLKKLQALSLRLGLAKVFLTLENTDTEVMNLKAYLATETSVKFSKPWKTARKFRTVITRR